MKTMRIGIIREGKIPQDYRVALTPMQCLAVQKMHPSLKIVVQTSPIRAFKDEEYASLGSDIVEDLADCDVIVGIKEVPIEIVGETKIITKEIINTEEIDRLTQENNELKSKIDLMSKSIESFGRKGKMMKNSDIASLYDE